MALLKFVHRDCFDRVIREGDAVVWSPPYGNARLTFGIVTGMTKKRVYVLLKNDYRHWAPRDYPIRIAPKYLLVVTQQLEANLAGNVGGAKELEQSRSE